MTGNRKAVWRSLNDRQLETVKCVSPLTTISGSKMVHNFYLVGNSKQPGGIKKWAAHSENFLGGLVCTGNLALLL